MSIWLEKKYINLISSQLRNFQWAGQTGRCSCPVCGDSKTNKTKARFYFLQKDDRYNIYCHNCGVSGSFQNFLKNKDNQLYDEFIKEILLEKLDIIKKPEEEKIVIKKRNEIQNSFILSGLTCIKDMDENQQIVKYIKNRMIPKDQYHRLFYTNDFNKFINSIIPNKLPDFKEPRLVIPFYDENKNIFCIQGRSLKPTTQRYITILLKEDMPKIYGLDVVNRNIKHYIVEGPLDSLFIPNCLAMAGSDLKYELLNEHSVMVYDNQPRNKSVIKKIEKCIEKKLSVVIWPENIKDKDINDLVLSGMTKEEVLKIIEDNTYSYLEAELKLSKWRKV